MGGPGHSQVTSFNSRWSLLQGRVRAAQGRHGRCCPPTPQVKGQKSRTVHWTYLQRVGLLAPGPGLRQPQLSIQGQGLARLHTSRIGVMVSSLQLAWVDASACSVPVTPAQRQGPSGVLLQKLQLHRWELSASRRSARWGDGKRLLETPGSQKQPCNSLGDSLVPW